MKGPSDPTKLHDTGFSAPAPAPASLPLPPGDRHHELARAWLESELNGPTGVGLPWQVLNGFAAWSRTPGFARTHAGPRGLGSGG